MLCSPHCSADLRCIVSKRVVWHAGTKEGSLNGAWHWLRLRTVLCCATPERRTSVSAPQGEPWDDTASWVSNSASITLNPALILRVIHPGHLNDGGRRSHLEISGETAVGCALPALQHHLWGLTVREIVSLYAWWWWCRPSGRPVKCPHQVAVHWPRASWRSCTSAKATARRTCVAQNVLRRFPLVVNTATQQATNRC